MYAAVVTAFDSVPRYQEFPTPIPTGANDMLVDVLAVGLHPRVRSQASGSHYTSTSELPLVPGVDGVGRGPDGLLRYFILPDTTKGSMAQQTVIDTRRSAILAESSDAVAVAAAMNPAMASWIALRQRVAFEPGQKVLVLGATGNAGQMAVRVAKLFGATEIIAAGRGAARLAGLPAFGATSTVALDGDASDFAHRLGQAATDVDVVIDFLWGDLTAEVMAAVITGRRDDRKPITWVEIGSVAGPTAAIPSAALRAARLQIVGSGQGSVSASEIVAELPALAREISSGTFALGIRAVPLADVERTWAESVGSKERIVFTPQA
jgi:NADPH:quinone reductase-like Zn-dependent oxidoreductase